jgi:hypothetical protein
VTSPRDFLDGDGLGRIGIDDVIHRDGLNYRIDLAVVRDDRLGRLESVLQQAADQRMVVQSTVCRPVLGIQIAVHQELGEGEETEHHGIGLYFPSRLARNSLRDAGDVTNHQIRYPLRSPTLQKLPTKWSPGIELTRTS